MSDKIYVDKKRCISCGKCVKECGKHIRIQENNCVEIGNYECSGCLHCYSICPQNAIVVQNSNLAKELKTDLVENITTDGLSSFLAFRRSIRSYQKTKVEDETVKILLDRARYIPSGGNAHSYEFTVLQSDETKKRIREALINIYRFRNKLLNNRLLCNIVKPFVNKQMREFLKSKTYGNRMRDILSRLSQDDDPFFYHAPVVIVIHSKELIPTPKEDAVLAGYNICLIAQTMGLGTCFVTLAQNAFNESKKCKKILQLSTKDNVYAVVTLGYSNVNHQRIAPKPTKIPNWI